MLTKDVESITDKSLSGLLNLGGTMLGTSREKPFKKGGVVSDVDKPSLILQNIREMELDCVVCIGGNGTQKTAAKFAAMGVNIVSVPKTIDNDIWGTDISFGFDSAVSIATDAIDRLHSTASSHKRVIRNSRNSSGVYSAWWFAYSFRPQSFYPYGRPRDRIDRQG